MYLKQTKKDFYEFANAMGILLKGKVEDKLKLAFDIYDYNDDGFIEKKEAETIVNVNITINFLKFLNLFTKKRISKMFKTEPISDFNVYKKLFSGLFYFNRLKIFEYN